LPPPRPNGPGNSHTHGLSLTRVRTWSDTDPDGLPPGAGPSRTSHNSRGLRLDRVRTMDNMPSGAEELQALSQSPVLVLGVGSGGTGTGVAGFWDKYGLGRTTEEAVEDDEVYNSVGAFQRPHAVEMLGMLLSFAAVMAISIAAGLTTVYDWVL